MSPQPKRSAYKALRSRAGFQEVETIDYAGFKTALRNLIHCANPQMFAAFVSILQKPSRVHVLDALLFSGGEDLPQRQCLARAACILSRCAPGILLDRLSWPQAEAAALDTHAKLLQHCLGLVCRGAGPTMSPDQLVDYALDSNLDVRLTSHVTALFKLRVAESKVYKAAIESSAGTARRVAGHYDSTSGHTPSLPTVERQILLNRALHLQRAVAFVVAYRRQVIPVPMRHLIFNTTLKVGGIAGWIDALEYAATTCLKDFETFRKGQSPATRRGKKNFPERWISLLFQTWWQSLTSVQQQAYATGMPAIASAALAAIRTLRKVNRQFSKTRFRYCRQLADRAGIAVPRNVMQMDLFTLWAAGLTERAFLAVVALTLVEAIEECDAVTRPTAARRSRSERFEVAEGLIRGISDVHLAHPQHAAAFGPDAFRLAQLFLKRVRAAPRRSPAPSVAARRRTLERGQIEHRIFAAFGTRGA